MRRLTKVAGIPPVCPHDCRHKFVAAALDADVSLRDVQDAAGHATRRYDYSRHSLDRRATYSVAAHVA